MASIAHERGEVQCPPQVAGRAALRALWEHLYAGVERDGPLYLATWSGKRVPGKKDLAGPQEAFFRWPGQAEQAERWLRTEADREREAYFCAHLLTGRRRVKANAAQMIAVYVDGDGAQVRDDQPRPSATVRSSPGREQFYWRLDRPVDPVFGEQLNKRMAAMMGADKSGWDLTQVLRPPGLPNFKYDPPATVELVEVLDVAYDPDELDRILPPIADEPRGEQAAVRVGKPTTAMPLSDPDARILEKMFGRKRGDQLRRLHAGDSSDFRRADGSIDESAADLSYFNALAFYADNDAGRMARIARSGGRYRDKWDERHYSDGRTYLEGTIGEAIGSCPRTYTDVVGYPADKVWPELQVSKRAEPAVTPGPPKPGGDGAEGCLDCIRKDAEILRLRRALLDAADRIDSLASDHEVQAGVIRAQRAELELRAEDRRLIEAQNRLRRVKAFSATQKDVIIATARLATSAASRGNPEPVITRAMVADEGGCHEGTAGPALKVFDIPGSPIPRDTRYVSQTDADGRPLRKKITVYPVRTEKPADIIEAMIEVGRGLEARPTRSPGRSGCPKGCNAGTRTVCAQCGEILRETCAPVDASDSLASVPPPAPAVDDLRTKQERLAPIGADPPARAPEPAGLFDPALDAVAAAAVGFPMTATERSWRGLPAESNGRAGGSLNGHAPEHPPPCWHCARRDGPGSQTCEDCGLPMCSACEACSRECLEAWSPAPAAHAGRPLWQPSGSEWEEVPEGTMQPPGLEYRLGMGAGGRRFARRPEVAR